MSVIQELSKIRASSTFLSLRGYRSAESGELADFQISFHMSYASALERSILALEAIVPGDDLQAKAKQELLSSYKKSLDKVKSEPLEVLGDHYDRVIGADGEHIKGIKIHKETGTLHLFGLLVNKRVLEPGTFKASNKRPLTVAKDKLRKLVPVSKFRQFIIDPAHVECIAVEKMEIAPE
jgi:hypothetical protein